MNRQLKANLGLLMVAILWGTTFIYTKDVLYAMETFNFLAVRFFIASFSCIIIFYKTFIQIDRETIKSGLIVGIAMFLAYAFQTVGLNYTTASKSAFISGLAVVIVPIISSIILKRKPANASIIAAFISIIGLSLLTLDGNLELGRGDILTLICAFGFASHIVSVSTYAPRVNPINLTIVQLLVVAVLSLIASFIVGTPIIPQGTYVWSRILFLAIVCTSGAFLIQNVAQKNTNATHAALILSSEPLFAAIFAFIILGEILPFRGFVGGILILFSIIISEVNIPTHIFTFKIRKLRGSVS
ncbi:DMT family transporter [Anaeromicrobium sediminis]|uniref:Multidrug DMT transporter permease n=1 Tax=Anaeromicrobium sediminis TaxID=1478221 RepID=A0A267MIT6_9FIRM|nr:DMT family transporter [Anaeromicrobium sediminis]PAB58710.1 multidrug DMT transporter permease [Anaeromicrobium sediminis]